MTSQPRVALVTGANRGIGLETVRQLSDAGFEVMLGSRNLDAGQEAQRALGRDRVRVISLDVVWAAQLPDNGPTGGFFRDGRRIEW